jgi:hypothetical protein
MKKVFGFKWMAGDRLEGLEDEKSGGSGEIKGWRTGIERCVEDWRMKC